MKWGALVRIVRFAAKTKVYTAGRGVVCFSSVTCLCLFKDPMFPDVLIAAYYVV